MSEVVVQTKAGRLHRGNLVNGKLRAFEGCNLDDAEDPTVLTEEEAAYALSNAEPHQLCQNDFPPVGDAE